MQEVAQQAMAAIQAFRFVPGETFASSVWFPVGAAGVYLAAIVVLRQLPAPGAAIKPIVSVHNLNLLLLSVSMLVGVLAAAYTRFTTEGGFISGLVCSERETEALWDGPLGFWTYVFYLSKFYELLDTMFLVLQGKSLLALHVWHHAVMPFVTWTFLAYPWLSGAWWCVFVNSAIHTAMYYYYLRASLGFSAPWWKKYLTQAQIFQFLTGTTISMVDAYLRFGLERKCSGTYFPTGVLANVINVSFIALFIAFFFATYKTKKPKKEGHKSK